MIIRAITYNIFTKQQSILRSEKIFCELVFLIIIQFIKYTMAFILGNIIGGRITDRLAAGNFVLQIFIIADKFIQADRHIANRTLDVNYFLNLVFVSLQEGIGK